MPPVEYRFIPRNPRLKDLLPFHFAGPLKYIGRIQLPVLYYEEEVKVDKLKYTNTYPERHPMKACEKLLHLTNRYRKPRGLKALKLSRTLCDIARAHSNDQASHRKMTHVSSNGKRLSDRCIKRGYSYRHCSENVAVGQNSERHVTESWYKSPGHKRNMLGDRDTEMGAWVSVGGGKRYWTQVFGKRR